MIAVSSHRPHSHSEEFRSNQILAKRTWEGVFQRIIYLGEFEPELNSPITQFIETDQWPFIRKLMEIASTQRGFVAILNADLVLDPKLRPLEHFMRGKGYCCASSRRFHFDPGQPDFHKALAEADCGNDRGRDIFIARNDVWRRAMTHVPMQMRIGHGRWDAWMVDYFRSNYNESFMDFTDDRLVFHPIHGDRRRPHEQEAASAY